MRHIYLFFITFSIFAENVEFHVYQGITVGVKLNKYENPIHIGFDEIVSLNGNPIPAWLETYLMSNDLLGINYTDWIDLYEENYSAGIMDMSEDSFNKIGKRYADKFGIEKSSILCDVIFELDEVKYAYALFYDGEFLSSIDEELNATEITGSAFIFKDDRWRLYRISSGPLWFRKICMNSYSLIEQVVRERNFVLKSENSYPSFFSDLIIYDFFKPETKETPNPRKKESKANQ